MLKQHYKLDLDSAKICHAPLGNWVATGIHFMHGKPLQLCRFQSWHTHTQAEWDIQQLLLGNKKTDDGTSCSANKTRSGGGLQNDTGMDRGSSEDEDEQTGADKNLSTSSNPARHNNKLATMKTNSVVSNGTKDVRSNFYGSPRTTRATAGEVNIRWKPGCGADKTAAVNGSSSSSSYEKMMNASGTKMKMKLKMTNTRTHITEDHLTVTTAPRHGTIKVFPSTSATTTSGDALGTVHGSSSSGTGNLRSRSSSSSQPSTAAQHQLQQMSTKDQLVSTKKKRF